MSILTSFSPVVRAGSDVPSWHGELRDAVRDVAELCRRLSLPAKWADNASAAEAFPLFVPPSFLARMRPGDPDDPLLRQVLPVADEAVDVAEFSLDPVGDSHATLRSGVLQKYAGRALLIATGVCAVHCRYCFRRHFPYSELPRGDDAWNQSLEAIATDESIDEVIFSGGDPLMLADFQLAKLVQKIAAIDHVLRLRIHTRLPIMIPSRVTEELIAWLTDSRLTPVLVIHANHAQELDLEVTDALWQLRRTGVMLLNQAVLLRGVNDSVKAQRDLSQRLIECGVLPYYLHQLDRVAGAAHFEVSIDEGRRIVAALRAELPGYAVPRYVQEIPGESHKRILA